MTRAHSAVPFAEAADLEAATAVVRSCGLRLSTARRLVLEALYAGGWAEDAPSNSRGRSDIASVYRNLETLEEVGLVRHLHLGHGPWSLRAVVGARSRVPAVRGCGAVVAVEPEQLDGVGT